MRAIPGLLLFGVVLLAIGPALAAEDADAKLIAMEKGLWEAWKNADVKPFEMNLANEGISIGGGRLTAGKAAMIADIAKPSCQVTSYSLSDVTVHHVSKSAAVLTYAATQDAVCDGHKAAPKVLASSVWVLQDGKWMAAAYHESPSME